MTESIVKDKSMGFFLRSKRRNILNRWSWNQKVENSVDYDGLMYVLLLLLIWKYFSGSQAPLNSGLFFFLLQDGLLTGVIAVDVTFDFSPLYA